MMEYFIGMKKKEMNIPLLRLITKESDTLKDK
jgi:hypothetical protein